MIKVDKNTATSTLLEVKIGSVITDGHEITGTVTEINITDTDEFWLFIFYLDEKKQIEIRKIKNIC
ncbi:hypothetical protein [Pedobacter aquatilis]|uniref:hypothetical protein n=1 Tax=Pedobacter aquatilis TaxID=351343 RepID=UPI00292EFF6A|nr:hypothetical protein [Pedobacter aquatilis]